MKIRGRLTKKPTRAQLLTLVLELAELVAVIACLARRNQGTYTDWIRIGKEAADVAKAARAALK
ncbi:MAG: hypothetical protein GY953_53700 [bacterium]|nr:hypothetical protein [bacterium]